MANPDIDPAKARDILAALKRAAAKDDDEPRLKIIPGLFGGGGGGDDEPRRQVLPPRMALDLKPASDPNTIGMLDMFANMLAEAHRDQQEALRPNKIDGLIAATNPVATTVSQACTAITLPSDAQIVGCVASAGDTAFSWSSFMIDQFQIIGSGQVPNDAFYPGGMLEKMLVPFANRIFDNQVQITGTVVNQSAANAYHHGLGVLYIDARCAATKTKLRPRERYLNINRLKERVANLLNAGALQRMKVNFFE